MIARTELLAAALAAVGAMAMGMGEVRAAIVTEAGAFTSDHCGNGTSDGTIGHCLPGQLSGGVLRVTGDNTDIPIGTTGTLTFSIQLFNGNQFINGGFDASFGFNLAGNPLITYTSITPFANFRVPPNLAPVAVPVTQAAGSLHMDGTGFFDYGLDALGNGGSQPQGSSLVFTITGDGLDLLSLESNGSQFFAADIISGTTGFTGAIDITPILVPEQQCTNCTDVPEPGALALLGSGLVGLGGVLWWRRRRNDEDDCNTLAA